MMLGSVNDNLEQHILCLRLSLGLVFLILPSNSGKSFPVDGVVTGDRDSRVRDLRWPHGIAGLSGRHLGLG